MKRWHRVALCALMEMALQCGGDPRTGAPQQVQAGKSDSGSVPAGAPGSVCSPYDDASCLPGLVCNVVSCASASGAPCDASHGVCGVPPALLGQPCSGAVPCDTGLACSDPVLGVCTPSH
jgi:hypothetical protein